LYIKTGAVGRLLLLLLLMMMMMMMFISSLVPVGMPRDEAEEAVVRGIYESV
jgi:hypothetical protein